VERTHFYVFNFAILQELGEMLRKVDVREFALHVNWPHFVVFFVVDIIEINFACFMSQR